MIKLFDIYNQDLKSCKIELGFSRDHLESYYYIQNPTRIKDTITDPSPPLIRSIIMNTLVHIVSLSIVYPSVSLPKGHCLR